MRSKPPSSTAWNACTSRNPLLSRMLRLLMATPGRRGGQRPSGGGAKWSQLAPCRIGRVKEIGILNLVRLPQKYAPYWTMYFL